jgi:hypothetical protein
VNGVNGVRVAPAAEELSEVPTRSLSTVYLASNNELPSAACYSYRQSRPAGLRGGLVHKLRPWGAG